MAVNPATHIPPGQHRECVDCGDDAVSRWNNRCYCLTCLDIAQAMEAEQQTPGGPSALSGAVQAHVKEHGVPRATTRPVPELNKETTRAMNKKTCPVCKKEFAYHRFPKGDPEGRCLYCVARANGGRKKPSKAAGPAAPAQTAAKTRKPRPAGVTLAQAQTAEAAIRLDFGAPELPTTSGVILGCPAGVKPSVWHRAIADVLEVYGL